MTALVAAVVGGTVLARPTPDGLVLPEVEEPVHGPGLVPAELAAAWGSAGSASWRPSSGRTRTRG